MFPILKKMLISNLDPINVLNSEKMLISNLDPISCLIATISPDSESRAAPSVEVYTVLTQEEIQEESG